MRQLSFFDRVGAEAAPEQRSPSPDFERLRPLSEAIPAGVHFGTSSWTFPGWAGLVYPAGVSQATLRRCGLGWYVRHPLLTTVGIDSSYYRPLTEATLKRYAEQLPSGFRCVPKAWSAVSTRVDPERLIDNPHFLDPDCFLRSVLAPLEAFRDHLGPIVLQLSPERTAPPPEPERFVQRLRSFLARVAPQADLAVELRQPELFRPSYLEALAEYGVAHVYNFWEQMPSLAEQGRRVGQRAPGHSVIRLLIPPGQRYADRRRALAPFNRIARIEEEMREQALDLIERLRQRGPVFVLVNNKAEGCAPLTIEALAEQLVARQREPSSAAGDG